MRLRLFYLFILCTALFFSFQQGVAQSYELDIDPNQKAKFRFSCFSESGDFLVTSEDLPNNHIKVWDAKTFRLLHALPIKGQKIEELAISPEGRYVAACIKENEIKIWDAVQQKIVANIESTLTVEDMQFSPDGKVFAVCGFFMQNTQRYGGFGHIAKKNVIDLFNFSKVDSLGTIGRYDRSFDGDQGVHLDYSDNGKYLLCANREKGYEAKNIQVWARDKHKPVFSMRINPLKRYPITKFIPNSTQLVYNDAQKYQIVDFISGKEKGSVPKKQNLYDDQFDLNKKGHFLYPIRNGFEVMDIQTKKVLHRVDREKIWLLKFHPTQPLVIATILGGTIEIWNYQEERLLMKLVSTKQEDGYVLLDPDGFYFGSKSGVAAITAKKEGKTYSYETVDLELNRPDIIFNRLPNIDPAEVEGYRSLVKERKALMNGEQIEEEVAMKKNLPSNPEEIGLPIVLLRSAPIESDATQNGMVNLMIKMKDVRYPLKKLQVYINSNPLLTRTYSGGKIMTETIPLQLGHGKNVIEVVVENQNGNRSLPQQLELDHEVSDFTQKVCFFGVGVSAYKNEKNLAYAHKDVQDVERFLKENQPAGFVVETTLLINEHATQSSIENLRSQLQKTAVDDIVILYFAGHGRRPTDQVDWCFKPYDYQKEKTGISDQLINDLIQESPSRKKIIVLDACYSGESFGVPNSIAGQGKSFNSRGAVEDDDEVLETATIDRIKATFNDLRNNSGAIIIAASGAKETAKESAEFSNGVFTYHFLEGLQSVVADRNFDKEITISELMAYIHDQIDEAYGQQPNFKRKYAGFDFTIWHRSKEKVNYNQFFDKD